MRRATSSRLWAAVRAAAALALLFTIAADVVADARCHSMRGRAATEVRAAAASADDDPCASGCVPDCYCCSRAVTSGPAMLPPDAGPVVPAVALRSPAARVGVLPSPYHPPLHIS